MKIPDLNSNGLWVLIIVKGYGSMLVSGKIYVFTGGKNK